MSMARRRLPSRLELKSLARSFKKAPLKKVSFTAALYDSPVQMPPSWDQTGVPIHFTSSRTSGSASLMRARILASVSPLQSPSAAILSLISLEASLPAALCRVFTCSLPFGGGGGGPRLGDRRRGLQAAPEEVRQAPEHACAHGPAPGLRAVAHREVRDDRRAEVDGEAGVSPLLEARRHRRQQ